MDITYWYLFPLGIIIATLSMSAGISGANFWIPVYLFLIKLDPLISFWLALLTMIFGFGSGVIRNVHQGTVNWYMVRQYLIPAVWGAILGSLLTSHVDGRVLVLIFGSFLFMYGTFMLTVSFMSVEPPQQHRKIYWGLGPQTVYRIPFPFVR